MNRLQAMIYPYHGILLSLKNKWTIYTQVGCISRVLCWVKKKKKKTTSRGHILYDSYIAFKKWQNYRDGKEISGCLGLGKVEGSVIGVTIKG